MPSPSPRCIRGSAARCRRSRATPCTRAPAHELCLVIEAVAPRWEDAEVICALGTRNLFYARLPEVKGTAGTAALMMDEVLRGKPGYEWTLNHVMPLADPLELTTMAVEVVGA